MLIFNIKAIFAELNFQKITITLIWIQIDSIWWRHLRQLAIYSAFNEFMLLFFIDLTSTSRNEIYVFHIHFHFKKSKMIFNSAFNEMRRIQLDFSENFSHSTRLEFHIFIIFAFEFIPSFVELIQVISCSSIATLHHCTFQAFRFSFVVLWICIIPPWFISLWIIWFMSL